MTDYLLLKISEMALRAIKAPKAPWKFTIDREYFFDKYPFLINDDSMYCKFPPHTMVMHNNETDTNETITFFYFRFYQYL